MTEKELQKILKSNKNAILYFYNSSCGHCKQLQPKIKLFESKNKSKFYFIDTFKDEYISDLFEVEWVPVLIHFKEGKLKAYEGSKKIRKFLS